MKRSKPPTEWTYVQLPNKYTVAVKDTSGFRYVFEQARVTWDQHVLRVHTSGVDNPFHPEHVDTFRCYPMSEVAWFEQTVPEAPQTPKAES